MTPRPLRTLALASLLAAAASAQSSEPPADVLSGPKVEDRSTPGVPSQFGESMDPRMRAQRIPFEVFLRAVKSLGEEPTPEAARLTVEQKQQIQEAQQAFQEANRAFMRDNMAELRELRERTGARPNQPGGAAQRPAADQNLSPEERAKLMQRLQELQSARPSSDGAHTKIYAILTPEQQKLVTAQLDAYAEQQIEQRAMQRLEALKAERAASTNDRNASGVAPGAAQRFGERIGVAPEKLEKIRAALTAPPTDAEKGLSFAERMNRRVDALPGDLATPAQKDAIMVFLLERAGDADAESPRDRARPNKNRAADAPTL